MKKYFIRAAYLLVCILSLPFISNCSESNRATNNNKHQAMVIIFDEDDKWVTINSDKLSGVTEAYEQIDDFKKGDVVGIFFATFSRDISYKAIESLCRERGINVVYSEPSSRKVRPSAKEWLKILTERP